MKTITKQLVFVLLIVFLGQNCAANKGNIKQKRCHTSCTESKNCESKKCKSKKCKSKKCKSKKCKSEQYQSQKVRANNEYGKIIESNPDLSVLAAHSLEISELRSQIQYLEERLNNAELPQGQERTDFKYSKKVILDNGTTLIGNITHQDNYWLQIETKIGVLSVDVNSIVQIIDATPSVMDVTLDNTLLEIPSDEYIHKQQDQLAAEIVLSSELFETRDGAYNTMISGEVENKGMKRADFVKITFTVYKNENYNTATKDYTVFIEGSTVAFEHGAVSNSSLYPNETGSFSVMIPSDFGPFISYSYRIDWEAYE